MVFGLFCNNHHDDDDRNNKDLMTPCVAYVLMEVVSARDLTHKRTLLDQEVDPYCIVRINNREVHRTTTIYNDPDPIWTVRSKSLCLLEIPETQETNDATPDSSKTADDDSAVLVEVCHGAQCLGVVTIPFDQVLAATGDRIEYPVTRTIARTTTSSGEETDDTTNHNNRPTLALRFRKATEDDLVFFGKASPRQCFIKANEASDINLTKVKEKQLFKSYSKRDTNQQVKFRVQPYPDPTSPQSTTWMSKQEIHQESLKPSKKWVEAGDGTVGKAYVEIIACHNLPNMDTVGVGDATDPFVGIVFEDTMVRTDVIHDSLSPKWMPWCTRAFCFDIRHASSLVFVGVFDFDSVKSHDPIGRVVINTANFQSNTSYLLHYALHDDPQQTDDRGTIVVRLCVEWKSESEARKLAFKLPPRFLINVENQKAFHVLRYTCRGRVNMEQASLESVRAYANELMSYGQVYCYVIDVMINVLLWRGRAKLFGGSVDVWFPIHSMALLMAAVVAMEVPSQLPAVVCFGIAYILLALNYYGSTHPYPWNRCKSWHETNMVLVLGRSVHPPIHIEPHTGVEEAAALQALDKIKGERVARFLWDAKTVGLKVKKVYNKTNFLNIAINTEEKKEWFADSLSSVHLLLYTLCTYHRLCRNFVNWKGYYTHKMTLMCLSLGIAWVVLPMNVVVLWMFRVVIWTVLGPWIKLVDVWYVHSRYRTKQELLEDPTVKDTQLETILTSTSLKEMGKSARLASEDAMKLKDMREEHFGKYSQLVPPVDLSRHPSIPLPESSARPYTTESDTPQQRWERVRGQRLEGHMIPTSNDSDAAVVFDM